MEWPLDCGVTSKTFKIIFCTDDLKKKTYFAVIIGAIATEFIGEFNSDSSKKMQNVLEIRWSQRFLS